MERGRNALMKPVMTNWISPYEAMMIPTIMAETLASFFMSGGVIMKAHVARRVAITLDAFFLEERKKSAFPLPIPRTEAGVFHTFNI